MHNAEDWPWPIWKGQGAAFGTLAYACLSIDPLRPRCAPPQATALWSVKIRVLIIRGTMPYPEKGDFYVIEHSNAEDSD
jgi:hypothetical protein